MHLHWHAIHWGDVPTWVAGVLTGVAVLATALGLRAEAKRTRLDREERADALKRSQAELVAAWVDRLSLNGDDYARAFEAWAGEAPGAFASAVGAVVFLRICNASQLPVYGVRYRFNAGNRGTYTGEVAVLPPGSVAELAIPLPRDARGHPTGPPDISFVDVRNRRWKRASDGALMEDSVGVGMLLTPEPGGHPSIEAHPTLHLPHPLSFAATAYSERTGTVAPSFSAAGSARPR